MGTWKGLAAVATVVAGGVAAFGIYTFGWHDDAASSATPGVRTVTSAGGTHRVITLRYGDVVLRPEAAARCEASGEGGRPNLFCTRLGKGGRHQVILYDDVVLVWPLDCKRCGPDGPVYEYAWAPKRR